MISDLEHFRSLLPVPEIYPNSYEELHLMLLEISFSLEHYMHIKDFTACSELTTKQSKLETYKALYPSLTDTRLALQDLRKELDDAMKAKNFRKCSELNDSIAAAESKLNTLDENEFYAYFSLEQLHASRTELEVNLEAASSEKAFEKCAKFQKSLDIVTQVLSARMIADDAVESKLAELEATAHQLKLDKDFKGLALISLPYEDAKWILSNRVVPVSAVVEESPVAEEVPAAAKYSEYSYEELSDLVTMHELNLKQSLEAKHYSRYRLSIEEFKDY